MKYFFNKRPIGNVKLFITTGGGRCEISTGVKLDGGDLHPTQGYLDDTRDVKYINKTMFDAVDRAEKKMLFFMENNDGQEPSPQELKNLFLNRSTVPTFKFILEHYMAGMANSEIMKKGGHELSEATKKAGVSVSKMLLTRLSKEILYEKMGATIIGTRFKTETFAGRIINRLAKFNYEDKSISGYMRHIRDALVWHDRCFNTNLSNHKSQFSITLKEKKVNLISREESDYIVDNFEEIREGCNGNHWELVTMDLWLCALLLGQRYNDMQSWDADNLEERGDATWVSFRQKKGDKLVSVPVHPKLLQVFRRNLVLKGKLIPKVNNVAMHIKNIAKRLPIFDYDFKREVYIKGQLHYKEGKRWEFLTLHEMRGTCITNLIEAGVSESIVKSISGHSANSKEFSRYVGIRDEAKIEAMEKMMSNVACDKAQETKIVNL
jgi:hypothetical protein